MKNKVITFRIDSQLEYEITYLKNSLSSKNTSQVVIEAIHSLYNIKKSEAKKSPFEMLEQEGLIGFIERSTNLSSQYKKENEEYISSKFLKKKNLFQ